MSRRTVPEQNRRKLPTFFRCRALAILQSLRESIQGQATVKTVYGEPECLRREAISNRRRRPGPQSRT